MHSKLIKSFSNLNTTIFKSTLLKYHEKDGRFISVIYYRSFLSSINLSPLKRSMTHNLEKQENILNPSYEKPTSFISSTTPTDYTDVDSSGNYHLDHVKLSNLIHSYIILSLCQNQYLTKNASNLINFSRNALGNYATKLLLKWTIFSQFCAGETKEDFLDKMAYLQNYGIGSIADFASEVEPPETSLKELEQSVLYNYEKLYEIMDFSKSKSQSFIAIKYSSLFSMNDLKCITNVLMKANEAFEKLTGFETPSSITVYLKDKSLLTQIHYEDFIFKGKSIFNDEIDLKLLFNQITSNKLTPWDTSESISYLQWTKFFSYNCPENLCLLSNIKRQDLPNKNSLNLCYNTLIEFLNKINNFPNLSVFVDAEQTFLQVAIDQITLDLQEIFNKDRCLLYNTYQAYRKDSSSRVLADIHIANLLSFQPCIKLVRGAYLNEEQWLAQVNGLQDPINSSLEETHLNYDNLVNLLITSPSSPAGLFLGTHNETTINKALYLLNNQSSKKNVFFGQLLGISDYLSFKLRANGLPVFKVLPYGPVLEVLPYLLRRVEENSDLLTKLNGETKILKQEIFKRLLLK